MIALDLGVDPPPPPGKMMASVIATFAQFERRLIGQRTKDAPAVKRAQGVVLGRPREIPESTIARIRGELHDAGLGLGCNSEGPEQRGIQTPRKGKCIAAGSAGCSRGSLSCAPRTLRERSLGRRKR